MISAYLDYYGFNLPSVQPTDVVEICIITYFIYQVLLWIKNTRAWMLFRGILIILGFLLLAAVFQMNTILWLGETLFSAGFVALMSVYHPELRKALEQLGRSNVLSAIASLGFSKSMEQRFTDRTVSDLVMASFEMGAVKTGALIVIEKTDPLTEYERTGISLDAVLTRQLLINIFEKNTPLHDGAVIVRGDRVVSATCYLPLSDNMELSKELGTRHRAAVGISEVSDAVTIVVSEETGSISIARDGELIRNVTDEQLQEELKQLQKLEDSGSTEQQTRSFWERGPWHAGKDKTNADDESGS